MGVLNEKRCKILDNLLDSNLMSLVNIVKFIYESDIFARYRVIKDRVNKFIERGI